MAKKKVDQNLAIAGLLLNVLVLPGLGTLIAGRNDPGVKQLVLAVVSIPLMFIFVGFITMLIAWIWALVSSIDMLTNESK